MTTPAKEKLARFPRHIAIIMDGNRRWAEQRRLPILEGHRAGVSRLRAVVEHLGKYHLPYLTVYSFSTENWSRAPSEVGGLLQLLEDVLDKETAELHKKGIRIHHLGRLTELPSRVQKAVIRATELTKHNKNMVINFAFNYGGRTEIIDAVRHLVTDHVAPEKIDEKLFSQYLYTAGIPDVDLVIRTGGESRLSNFLTWQTVYSELYFTDVLWPDFDAAEVDKALLFYSQKERRFGGS